MTAAPVPAATPSGSRSAETSPLTHSVAVSLRSLLAEEPSVDNLNAALRHLAKWRTVLLENTLVSLSGEAVLSGPFKGMVYGGKASEGSRTARLLGAYEAALAPVIETIIAQAYPLVIDVGSAEGYYAVGLARRMPGSRILARDENPSAQALCAALATANDVAGRIVIGGRLDHADFDICAAQPTAILCDIEGAEGELLDPVRAPGLLHADILVEVHEGMRPGLLAALRARFAPSHHLTLIQPRLDASTLPGWTNQLNDLDRLLLLWEWRASPTPWLWMQRK
jgi:hypothetical protein